MSPKFIESKSNDRLVAYNFFLLGYFKGLFYDPFPKYPEDQKINIETAIKYIKRKCNKIHKVLLLS